MSYFYDPLRTECKSRIGAFPKESEITFRIYRTESGEADFSAHVCALVLHEDGKAEAEFPMRKTDFGFSVTLSFHKIGLYFYHFRLDDCIFSAGERRLGAFTESINDWQITVFSEDFVTPDWMKGGIMYQIFPDRFYKAGELPVPPNRILRRDWGGTPEFRPNENGKVLNNDFFGGNFEGIRQKLGYLALMHVSVIYLNPIFEASSNHRYDTGDYMKPDPLLGTDDDFNRLVADAKKYGIEIILDGVFNHTGDDSRYFNKYGRYKEELGAHQSPDSPYFSWYRFRDFPDSYDSWWGIDTLPAVNETSAGYQEFILGEDGVVDRWTRRGIGGWRLDVADELPDFFIEKLRRAVKSIEPEAILIGEVWEDASNKISYDERRHYLQGLELDSVMNYPLKDGILNFMLTGNCKLLRDTMAQLVDNYPKQTLDCLMNVLGTHDTPRILTILGGKQCDSKEVMSTTRLTEDERMTAEKKLKMAVMLQFTLPGVPCVFYGDEIGMEGYQDPFCRGCFDWEKTGGEIGKFYEKLGRIRTQDLKEIFRDGDYGEIYAEGGCFVFERRAESGTAYIFANNSTCRFTVHLDGKFFEHLTGENVEGSLELNGFSYGILTKCK